MRVALGKNSLLEIEAELVRHYGFITRVKALGGAHGSPHRVPPLRNRVMVIDAPGDCLGFSDATGEPHLWHDVC